jgi:GAF domain-containing protein
VTAGSPGRSREHWIAEEQAALRRVAMLVARAAPPEEVFAAVAAEAGRVLAADVTGISRYDRAAARSQRQYSANGRKYSAVIGKMKFITPIG